MKAKNKLIQFLTWLRVLTPNVKVTISGIDTSQFKQGDKLYIDHKGRISANSIFKQMTEEKKCKGFGNITEMLIYDTSDVKFNNGIMTVKRKYGKFHRKPVRIKYG